MSKGLKKITLITRADVLAQDEATDNDPNQETENRKVFSLNNLETIDNKSYECSLAVRLVTFAGLVIGDIYRLIWSIILLVHLCF